MSQRPNILVLFSDDHGQWALPPYGNSELVTPSVNQLAASGTVLENAFTPVPVCSPARACFFTGLLPSQHGIHDYLAWPEQFHGKPWLKPHATLHGLLQNSGYRTGLSGKWHMGQDDLKQQGFDDWFALAGDYPIEHKGAHRYSDNGEIVTRDEYKTHLFTDRTVQFIRDWDRKQPFFHFTGFYATHSPWEGQPERLVNLYRNCHFNDIPSAERVFGGEIKNIELPDDSPEARREAKAQYYASISAIDEGIGRILDELETAGALDNTIIVYTSDHGLCLDHHGIWGKGNATSPQNMIEESMRIPMILSAPGRVKAGQRLSHFTDHLDLFQTLLDFAEIEAPDDRNFAGSSLKPHLVGETGNWRDAQFGEYGTARMIRTETHKLVKRYDNQPDELYDLTAQEGEGRNLLANDEGGEVHAALSQKLEQHFAQYEEQPIDTTEFFAQPRFNMAEAWR